VLYKITVIRGLKAEENTGYPASPWHGVRLGNQTPRSDFTYNAAMTNANAVRIATVLLSLTCCMLLYTLYLELNMSGMWPTMPAAMAQDTDNDDSASTATADDDNDSTATANADDDNDDDSSTASPQADQDGASQAIGHPKVGTPLRTRT
jgi:hypothetical protein